MGSIADHIAALVAGDDNINDKLIAFFSDPGSFLTIESTTTKLAEAAVSTAASPISITVPNTARNLALYVSARSTQTAVDTADLLLRMNNEGVGSGVYSAQRSTLSGTVQTLVRDQFTDQINLGTVPADNIGNVWGDYVIDILDYASFKKRQVLSRGGSVILADTPVIYNTFGQIDNTNTLATITLLLSGGLFAVGSRYTLYGYE